MILDSTAAWIDKGTLIFSAIGLVGTAIGLVFTYLEYQKSNKTKRAEFLEKLTEEFNQSKMLLAKKILDDFWVFTAGTEMQSDKALLSEGSYQERPDEMINNELKNILRNHKDMPVILEGEQRIRQSFDDLLDFFSKLDYYLKLELIEKEELNYFKYYIEKCAGKNDAILKYAITYHFPSLYRLLFILEIPIQNDELRQHQQRTLNDNENKRTD